MPLIEKKLTVKQQAFADAYVELGNATQAYLKVYPNVKKEETASVAGSRMLGNVKVKAYIDERMEQLQSERVADRNIGDTHSCFTWRNDISSITFSSDISIKITTST